MGNLISSNKNDIFGNDTYRFGETCSRADNVQRFERAESCLESCVQLCPVGYIGLLENGLGSAGVCLHGFGGFGTQGEVCNDYVATRFEEAEREGKGDTTAATSNQRSLAIEIVGGHSDGFRYQGDL